MNPTPEFAKGCFIEGVLGLGTVNVDWRAIEVGEFAASNGWAHAPSDGDAHAGNRNRTLGVGGIAGFLVWAHGYAPRSRPHLPYEVP